jgi:hypothetical protein
MMPIRPGGLTQGKPVGILLAWLNLQKQKLGMTKTLEVISEAIRSSKPPFRKVDSQPKKPLKHRYERRKIKEYLHLGEWVSPEAT